jgi:hypothetical protein
VGRFGVVGLGQPGRQAPEISTSGCTPDQTTEKYPSLRESYLEFEWLDVDVRDGDGADRVVAQHSRDLELVVQHTAAQPPHDWAATDPQTDFGDLSNRLPLEEFATRLDLLA